MSSETQEAMEALLELSGFPRGKNEYVDRMVKLIAKAPDAETACQVITDEFQATGALERKWRKIINQTWLLEHKASAYPLDLALTSQDVVATDALSDARRFLETLSDHPAAVVRHGGEFILAPEELPRLAAVLPSIRGRFLPDTIEHEWACVSLRRLRLLLQTLKLVRVYRGKLQVVASRYERFLDSPLPQQFYALWHADVYHVPWGHFAASWSPYIDVVQEYLPLLWDVARGTRAGQMQTATELTYSLMDIYQTLWEQEGVVSDDNDQTFLAVYEEYALPAVIGQLLVQDILARYGLIQLHEGLPALIRSNNSGHMFDSTDTSIRWTAIGEVMVAAEASEKLPCGLEIVK